MKKAWKRGIKLDERKVIEFKKRNNKGYYLIVIPHTVYPHQMQNFIVQEFVDQTKVTLPLKGKVDWKKYID